MEEPSADVRLVLATKSINSLLYDLAGTLANLADSHKQGPQCHSLYLTIKIKKWF